MGCWARWAMCGVQPRERGPGAETKGQAVVDQANGRSARIGHQAWRGPMFAAVATCCTNHAVRRASPPGGWGGGAAHKPIRRGWMGRASRIRYVRYVYGTYLEAQRVARDKVLALAAAQGGSPPPKGALGLRLVHGVVLHRTGVVVGHRTAVGAPVHHIQGEHLGRVRARGMHAYGHGVQRAWAPAPVRRLHARRPGACARGRRAGGPAELGWRGMGFGVGSPPPGPAPGRVHARPLCNPGCQSEGRPAGGAVRTSYVAYGHTWSWARVQQGQGGRMHG
jgi:hypothetical protein